MRISISALSVAYGLTPEALRYYEEKGLLTPERTASGGFRKFSLADVQKLSIIKSLQKLGFTLDEIRTIMTGCSVRELLTMLDEKRCRLQEQLAMQSAILNRLSLGADLLRDSDTLLMQPRMTQGAPAYLIDFDNVSQLWEQLVGMPILKALIDGFPLTSFCSVLPKERLEGMDVPARVGMCVPCEYAALIEADLSQMKLSASPHCVRVLFDLIGPKGTGIEAVEKAALCYMKEKNAVPICEGYTRQYMLYTDELGRKRHFAELFIPVE